MAKGSPLPDGPGTARVAVPAFTFGADTPPASYELERLVTIRSDQDAEVAARLASRTAALANASRRCQLAASIVASELATNVFKFGRRGRVEIRIGHPYLELVSYDDGPGIAVPAVDASTGEISAPWLRPGTATYAYGLGAVVRLMGHVTLWGHHPEGLRILSRRHLTADEPTPAH